MTPERWQQVRDLLASAMQLAPGQRQKYLDQECRSDPSLRADLDSLLGADAELRTSFLTADALDAALSHTRTKPAKKLQPGTTLGRYEILDLIGAGGMGEVYRARDTQLPRLVAIKVLPSDLSSDPERRKRFQREAHAIATLQHAHICTLYDVGSQDGADFLVMEYLDGETLAELLQNGALPLQRTLRIGYEVADALDAAARRGIVHRDLKPGNIFVTTHGESKVLDFGLAKLGETVPTPDTPTALTPDRETQLTTPGDPMGTVAYMSPEQARGEELDARSDVFSLGAVLYEMATGKQAFPGRTSAVVFKAILDETPTLPSTINPLLPPQFDHIVEKALEKDRTHRYQHASDLLADLQSLHHARDPNHEHPTDRAPERSPSPVFSGRRKRLFYSLVAAGVLLAVYAGWSWSRRESSLRRELKERKVTHNLHDNPISSTEISPDGRHLAYTDDRGLHLLNIDSGELHDIPVPAELRASVAYVTWFPDGERLVVGTYRASQGSTLWLASVFSGLVRTFRTHSGRAKVSPDGSLVAFVSGHGHEVWVSGSDGTNPRVILSEEVGEYSALAWSPSGRQLACVKAAESGLGNPQGGNIETISLDKGPPITVLSDPGLDIEGVAWLSDGRLVYSSSGGAALGHQENLWQISMSVRTGLRSGKPLKVATWPGADVFLPTASKDAKRLVAVRGYYWSDVYVGDLKDHGMHLDSPRVFTSSESLNFPLTWMRDSRTLLLLSDRLGSFQIFKQQLHNDNAELVVSDPDDQMFAALTPDAKSILYLSQLHGVAEPLTVQRVMRLPASGDMPQQVLQVPLDPMTGFRCPAAPSRSCILSRWEQGQLIFYALDPFQGLGKDLIRTKLSHTTDMWWSLSSDGDHIAIATWTQLRNHVRVLDMRNHTERDLKLPDGWRLMSLCWSADDSSLFAFVDTTTRTLLARVDLTGRTNIIIESKAWGVDPLSLAPSPDGRRLAYYQPNGDANVWLLENF